MHRFDENVDTFANRVFTFARHRAAEDVNTLPLGHPKTKAELDELCGPTVTDDGIGAERVLQLFAEVLEPACLSVDFPRYLAFVPAAPTETSILADLAISACSIYAGSWQEGAGAVWAENEALRWIADLAGLPRSAGGCFVAGGTAGNLSSLVAARDRALRDRGGVRPDRRWVIVAGETSHSSILTSANVMDAELVIVPGDRLRGEALLPVLDEVGDRVCAVVATAGTTNLGIVDDLRSTGELCRERGIWFHVDGAYGGAGLAAPSVRERFDGIELADSFIVDPHKWLFAPFDACALVYRDPAHAQLAHTQHAAYLEVLTEGGDWNPSDFAIHLSRRARGLPFWFSLAAHGAAAYRDAVEHCLTVTREAAELIRADPDLELVREPELSVVAFERRGWSAADYDAWSLRVLEEGTAFVVPSAHGGRPILRFCIVNPRTTIDDIRVVLDTLRV